jgi:hypothetical protein
MLLVLLRGGKRLCRRPDSLISGSFLHGESTFSGFCSKKIQKNEKNL